MSLHSESGTRDRDRSLSPKKGCDRALLHRCLLAVLVIVLLLVADQALKIWVKTSFFLGEGYAILPFFELRFVQNNGMAFGMELGSKMLLSVFRIVVVGLGVWYLCHICRDRRYPKGYIVCIALILAGALGNIIDCVFYGMIFNNPMPPEVASFVPWGQGYGTLLHGLVVDMLYFPLFSFVWPEWMPWVGGDTFSFFDPVFNIADSAITVGMFMLILFYSKYIGRREDATAEDKA